MPPGTPDQTHMQAHRHRQAKRTAVASDRADHGPARSSPGQMPTDDPSLIALVMAPAEASIPPIDPIRLPNA